MARPVVPLAPSGRMLDLAAAVDELTRDQGFAPSLRELAGAIGTNVARAAALARGARERGLVTFKDSHARTIRVIDHAAIRRKRTAKA